MPPIKPGEAVISRGHNFANKYVIQCLGPVYGRDEPAEKLLANCYCNALRLADTYSSLQFFADITGIAPGMHMQLGYGVVAVENGHEALSIVKEGCQQIDCVLTDLSMPGMDGGETIASLKRMNPEIPVILASGYDEATLGNDKKRESPDAFIQKPCQIAELKAALRQIMN